MPVLTPEELERKYGVNTSSKFAAPTVDAEALERKYGLRTDEKKAETPPAEESSYIGDVIKKGLANTPEGLALRAAGAVDYEDKDLGMPGNIASEVISFAGSPTTYVTGGIAGLVGKGVIKEGVKIAGRESAKRLAARGAVQAGLHLAELEAVKDPLRQYEQTGTVDPMQTAGNVAKAGIAGAALGPAGAVKNPLLRAGAEVATMAETSALMEGHALPTEEQWVHAAGTVGGFKVAHAITKAVSGKTPEQINEAAQKMAALAEKEKVTRKEYMEATGVKQVDVPDAVERKAAAVAAAEAVKPKEIVNEGQQQAKEVREEGIRQSESEVREQGQEVVAPAPAPLPGDMLPVKPAGQAGGVSRETGQDVAVEPTKLGRKAEAARAEAKSLWEQLEATKSRESLFSTGVDPERLKLFAKAFTAEIKAGALDFADYVQRVVSRIGHDAARTLKGLIRETWEVERKGEPAGDIDAILDGIKGDAHARPDLSRPFKSEAAKEAVNVVDAARNIAGEPKEIGRAAQDIIADQNLATDAAKWKQRLLDGEVASETGDTATYKKIIDSLPDGEELIKALIGWRAGGEVQGREFEARKMDGKDGQRFFAREALFLPPDKVQKQIRKAQAREKKERQKTPSVHKLRPDEIPQPEGMKAPFGFKGEPKPREKTQGPESKKSYEARRKKAGKTAAELARDWHREVERLRARLSAMGHNVDAALRGELTTTARDTFIRDAYALKSSTPDYAYELWRNSILSGPATGTTNLVGQSANAAWYLTAERITEAVVDSIARSVGMRSDGARFGELKYIFKPLVEQYGKSMKKFFETWRSEIPSFNLQHGKELEMDLGHSRVAIPGKFGRFARGPQRLLQATDDAVKVGIATRESNALAYRQAVAEGLKGKDMENRMRELLNDPTSDVNKAAVDTAIRLSLQQSSPFLKTIGSARKEVPGMRYVVPFITTPFNIFRTGIRKSPFGSIKLGMEVLKAHETGDWSKISPRVAEQVLAWGATLAIASMNDPKDPWITGSDGNRPYSVKLFGHWWNYSRVEPFASTLALLVDGINKIHEGKDLFDSLKAPFNTLLERTDHQTFLLGVSDFIKAAQYGEIDYALNWASKFPASWVPNIVRAPLRNADDEVPNRRVWGKGVERTDRMLKRGMQAFEVMPDYPKRDLWGRPVPKDGLPIPHTDWLWRTLSPVGERRYVETVGDRLIARWNAANPHNKAEFRLPNPYFTENGETFYFTDEEYDTYVRESGKLTQQRIIAMQNSFDMNNPTQRDIRRLQKIVETSRARIRNAIKRARRKAVKNAA